MEYKNNKGKLEKVKKHRQLSSTIHKIKKENEKEIPQHYKTTSDNDNISIN